MRNFIDTRNPVNRLHPLNVGRTSWLVVVRWLAGGPTWFDLMGNFPGTLSGSTPAWGPKSRAGSMGQIECSGSNDIAATGPVMTGSFTVACWLYLTSYSGDPVICRDTIGHAFQITSGGQLKLFQFGVNQGTTIIGLNGWHRVAMTFNGSSVSFWVDGILDVSFTENPSNAPVSRIASYSGSNYISGRIDDFATWSRPLSAAEIFLDYQLGRCAHPSLFNQIRG